MIMYSEVKVKLIKPWSHGLFNFLLNIFEVFMIKTSRFLSNVDQYQPNLNISKTFLIRPQNNLWKPCWTTATRISSVMWKLQGVLYFSLPFFWIVFRLDFLHLRIVYKGTALRELIFSFPFKRGLTSCNFTSINSYMDYELNKLL